MLGEAERKIAPIYTTFESRKSQVPPGKERQVILGPQLFSMIYALWALLAPGYFMRNFLGGVRITKKCKRILREQGNAKTNSLCQVWKLPNHMRDNTSVVKLPVLHPKVSKVLPSLPEVVSPSPHPVLSAQAGSHFHLPDSHPCFIIKSKSPPKEEHKSH